MKVKKNHSLKNYNTFGVDVKTKYFAEIRNLKGLKEILEQYPNEKLLILGGGSNTLLVDDWEGLTLKMEIKEKKIVEKTNVFTNVKVGSGENWDNFVKYTVKNNWSGIENLVMIPGTVGAAVAQNIGAYGQEVIDTLISIDALDISSLKIKTLSPAECGFRYRSTYFKELWEEKYIITSATFRLNIFEKNKQGRQRYHDLLTSKKQYDGLKEELENIATQPYGIEDVVNAIKKQREKKLPSLKEYGTCGSFFKNPIITEEQYYKLKEKIEDLAFYPAGDNMIKISAGKLLDELGWKGKWKDNVGVSEKHALCVVTNKEATGKEIYTFIKKMQENVEKEYGVTLEPEVNIIKN